MHYFDVTSPVDDLDRMLNFLSLRFATEVDVAQNVLFNPTTSNTVEMGEWCGLMPFTSVQSVDQIVRSNHSVKLFHPEIARPAHRFYVNKKYQNR